MPCAMFRMILANAVIKIQCCGFVAPLLPLNLMMRLTVVAATSDEA